jgi:hypothetical protein
MHVKSQAAFGGIVSRHICEKFFSITEVVYKKSRDRLDSVQALHKGLGPDIEFLIENSDKILTDILPS